MQSVTFFSVFHGIISTDLSILMGTIGIILYSSFLFCDYLAVSPRGSYSDRLFSIRVANLKPSILSDLKTAL